MKRNSPSRRLRPAVRDPKGQAEYLFRKFSRLLRAARGASDPKTVHQLRTTIRRLQALAVSTGAAEAKAFHKFDKTLEGIFDRAGKIRDLDVQLEELRTISLPSVEYDKVTVQNYLQRQRGKQQRKLAGLIEEKLAKRLPRRQRRAKAHLLSVIDRPAEDRANALDLRRELMPFIERLQQSPITADTLHELRLEIKHVRYSSEAAGTEGLAFIKLLKPVQDAIGYWHDWLQLLETSEKVLGGLPGHPLMNVLRGKLKVRYNEAVAVVKPLAEKLTEVLPPGKRPGPVLVKTVIASAG